MAMTETATGNDGVAITGTASAGKELSASRGRGDSVGVRGEGKAWHGVEGISDSTIGGFGVFGANTAGGTGVVGVSKGWHAVAGFSESTTGGFGVYGEGVGPGVVGVSKTWHGVHGATRSTTGGAGVSGRSLNPDGTVNQDGLAGLFEGKVVVTNDIVLSNADCAEDFDVARAERLEPGTVMVIEGEDTLRESTEAYDKKSLACSRARASTAPASSWLRKSRGITGGPWR